MPANRFMSPVPTASCTHGLVSTVAVVTIALGDRPVRSEREPDLERAVRRVHLLEQGTTPTGAPSSPCPR